MTQTLRDKIAEAIDGYTYSPEHSVKAADAILSAIAESVGRLVKLEYWLDTDQSALDDMAPDVREDHEYIHAEVKKALSALGLSTPEQEKGE